MKTFVISLAEAKERKTHITKIMEERNLEFEFFEAVDGRGFDVPNHPNHHTFKRQLYFGRNMKGGEIGVLLSHKSIYQKMVNKEIPISLILEDDVELYKDFPKILQALENGAQDFELVRFLGSKKVATLKQYTKRIVMDEYKLNRLCTTPGGAHAYIITFAGAVKMLRNLDKNYIPIDTLMGHCWKTGVNAFIIQPGLSRQNAEQPQYIGTERFDKTLNLSSIMKLAYPFGRAWFKIMEGLMKRVYYYKNILIDKLLKDK